MTQGSTIEENDIGFPSMRGITRKTAKFHTRQFFKEVKKTKQQLSDPTGVQYFILFGKFASDARQFEVDEYREYVERNADDVREGLEDIEESVLIKCIQTNVQGFSTGAPHAEGLIEAANTYSSAKALITGNDVLEINTTRGMQEVGGLFFMEIHNPNGKYNNTFVRGDHVEIRGGYENATGTDFGLQTIFVGVIRNVTINYSDSMGEIITLEGSDYESVLRDKSMENIIRRTNPTRWGKHLASDLIKEFNSMFTTEFGYKDVPFFYKQVGVGNTRQQVDIIKEHLSSDAQQNQPIVDLALQNLIQHQRPQSINLSMDNPLYDEGVWTYFKKSFEDAGLHVRLKTKSQQGVSFSRGSPQLILSPMNVMTSEMNEFVERTSNPHEFIYSDISSVTKPHLYRPNIEHIKLYEDSANIKNRVVVQLIIPNIITTESPSGRNQQIKATMVTIDSDKILFPERYSKYKKKANRNFYIYNYSRGATTYPIYKVAVGEKDGKKLYESVDTSLGVFEKEDGTLDVKVTVPDIEIDMRGKKPVTLKNMVDIHQRFFGKRTKHITKDSLIYLNQHRGNKKVQLSWNEKYTTSQIGKIDIKKIIKQCVKDIAKVLVEHVHAVKGKVTISQGNPSIDLFDCCKIIDKRELSEANKSKNRLETTAYMFDKDGKRKKKKFIDKVFQHDYPPTDSIGDTLKEFRVSSEDKGKITVGNKVIRNQSDLLHDGVPSDRLYVITYVNHIITADGFHTTLNFQFVPTYYTSEVMNDFILGALAPEELRQREINENIIDKNYRATIGIIVSTEDSQNYNYLKYMKEYHGDSEGLAGYPIQDQSYYENSYFDRALVRLPDGKTITATVLRQKYIYAPMKVGDSVALVKLNDGTKENDLQEQLNWAIMGVLETDSSLQSAMGRTPSVIIDKEKGLSSQNIIYDIDYKTGFDSNVNFMAEQKNQQSFIISTNDYTVFGSTNGIQSASSRKSAKSNKITFESNSKRDFSGGTRHQKSSINLNAGQGLADSNESGASLIELATYEVINTGTKAGWADINKPHSKLFMHQREVGSKAELNMMAKGTVSNNSTQSILELGGDGALTISAEEGSTLGTVVLNKDGEAYLYGTNKTIIGGTSDSGTEIIALDSDEIVISNTLEQALTSIGDALTAISSYTDGGAPVSAIPPMTMGLVAGVQISAAVTQINIALQALTQSKQSGNIGSVTVKSATRKIKGKA